MRKENLIFLISQPNVVGTQKNRLNETVLICFGYSKEPSKLDDSFEHTKYMLKLMDKKILTILR